MKKSLSALFFAVFSVLSVSAVEFGDIEAQYPLYSEADPFAIVKATNTYAIATNAAQRVALVESETNNWNSAYGWGDHAEVGYILPADLAGATNEIDLRVLRFYHYGNPDIVESTNWFRLAGDHLVSLNSPTSETTNFGNGSVYVGIPEPLVVPFFMGGQSITGVVAASKPEIGRGIRTVVFPRSIEAVAGPLSTLSSSSTAGLERVVFNGDVRRLNATGFGLYAYRLTNITFRASAYTYNTFQHSPGLTCYVENVTSSGFTNFFGGAPVSRGAAYVDSLTLNGDTRTVWPDTADKVDSSGGTATNLTLGGSVDATSATYVRVPAPVSGSDAATVDWVRKQFNSGVYYYNTTQYIGTAFATNTYLYATNNPAAVVPKSFSVVSNGQYISSIITPEHVALPHGPAVVSVWLEKTGIPSSSVSVKAELYFTADGTNVLFEAEDVTAQTVTAGTKLYQWVFHFPDQPSSYVVRRLKVTSVTGSPTVKVFGGGGYPSTLAITSLGAGGDELGSRGATNLIVNGVTQTYDSGTRTLSATVAGGGTTIYSAVTNLPLVASGETNRVTLYSDRSVYVVTATNAVNALTNSNGNLVLTGNKADWELWVNFTNPAGTNMLWCPCMRFDIAPEITVTGLYKFACSTLDGATVSVKQIYPTVMAWEQVPAAETLGVALGYGFYTLMADSATNDYLYLLSDDVVRPLWLRIAIVSSTLAVRTNAVEIVPGVGISGVVELWTNTVSTTICNANIPYSFASFVLPPLNSLCFGGASGYVGDLSNRYSLWFNRKAPGTGVVTSRAILGRRLNELEIKAYNAGWRP